MNKKIWIFSGAGLVALLLIGLFIWNPFKDAVPEADSDTETEVSTEIQEEWTTTLYAEEGTVWHNDVVIENEVILEEGDTIRVSEDGAARVVFFDDSVSRLKPGTELRLEVLNDSEFALGNSQILLDLQSGEIWSKVQPQASPDISFAVETNSVNAAIRGSTQNVATDGACNTTIMAPEHTTVITTEEGTEIVVFEDQKAQMIGGEGCDDSDTADVTVEDITDEDRTNDWFQSNKERDEQYQEQLRQRIEQWRQQQIRALPGTPGYEAQLQEDARKLEEAGDNAWKVLLEIAARQLIEAEILFDQGDGELARQQLELVIATLNDIALRYGDIPEAMQGIVRILQAAERRLAFVAPNQSAYEMKQSLRQLAINLAPEGRRLQIQENLLRKTILELHDFAKTAAPEELQAALQRFGDQLIEQLRIDPQFQEFIRAEVCSHYMRRTVSRTQTADGQNTSQLLQEVFQNISESIAGMEITCPETEAERARRVEEERRQFELRRLEEQRRLEQQRRLDTNGGLSETAVPVEEEVVEEEVIPPAPPPPSSEVPRDKTDPTGTGI